MPESPLKALFALVAAMFLWGSSFIAMKLAFRSFDPLVVIFGRMAVASLIFFSLYRKLDGFRFHAGDLKYLLFMALCEPCLYFLFEAGALTHTSASSAGMITATLPLMVSIAARLFLKENVTFRMMAGFALALMGVGGLSLGAESNDHAPNPALGNFLEFLAMVCATGYNITLKFLSRSYRPLFLTAVQAFTGALFYLPLLALPGTVLPTEFDPAATLSVIYLGSFITLGAYGLYNYGVSRIPASRAAAFINLIPVFTVLLGWIVLEERFTALQFAASALIFGGVFLSQYGKGRKKWRSGVSAPSRPGF